MRLLHCEPNFLVYYFIVFILLYVTPEELHGLFLDVGCVFSLWGWGGNIRCGNWWGWLGCMWGGWEQVILSPCSSHSYDAVWTAQLCHFRLATQNSRPQFVHDMSRTAVWFGSRLKLNRLMPLWRLMIRGREHKLPLLIDIDVELWSVFSVRMAPMTAGYCNCCTLLI